ncbi:WD40 repeat-like protein [Thozetella sp. PMI_491]|nr:WD40 repeat-like protein [Thozetella sp. PMI_491]
MAALAAPGLRSAVTGSFSLPRLSRTFLSSTTSATLLPSPLAGGRLFPSLASAVPASIQIGLPSIPSLLEGLWESILRAVPKKKTTHSKKRHRQMAGKALKDVTSLCKCPACGETKRMHYLCPNCTATHISDIFALAATPTSLLSAGGSSSLHIHSTAESTFPEIQTIKGAHKLGIHHLCTSRGGAGKVAATAGFGGEIKIWSCEGSDGWEERGEIPAVKGVVWAIALSADEQYLAGTTHDGKIHVWDLATRDVIQTYETGSSNAGDSFAMAVDLSRDGKLTASGHQNGSVYVFNNDAGRLVYSLSGLAKPVRAVAFSPGCKFLAAAGDAGIIAIYEMEHGQHTTSLAATHASSPWIMSIDWSETGEYLLSGSLDGKVKVWDVARGVCVATHSETDQALWSVRWLPKMDRVLGQASGRGEMFCAAGASRSITFYREATGA